MNPFGLVFTLLFAAATYFFINRVRKAKRISSKVFFGLPVPIFGLFTLLSFIGMFAPSSSLQASNVSNAPSTSQQSQPVESRTNEYVNISFTSDPSEAVVTINGIEKGKTPISIPVEKGTEITYTLVAQEPNFKANRYDEYKPYQSTLTALEDTALDVWIDRTTDEERKVQRREEIASICTERLAGLELYLHNWSWYEDYDWVVVEGQVQNYSDSTLENVQIVAEFYTSDDQFITSETGFVEYTTLLSGQTTPFKMYVDYNPAMATANLGFKTFWGDALDVMTTPQMELCSNNLDARVVEGNE